MRRALREKVAERARRKEREEMEQALERAGREEAEGRVAQRGGPLVGAERAGSRRVERAEAGGGERGDRGAHGPARSLGRPRARRRERAPIPGSSTRPRTSWHPPCRSERTKGGAPAAPELVRMRRLFPMQRTPQTIERPRHSPEKSTTFKRGVVASPFIPSPVPTGENRREKARRRFNFNVLWVFPSRRTASEKESPHAPEVFQGTCSWSIPERSRRKIPPRLW